MGFLIDSSILVDCERGRLGLSASIERSGDDAFFISVISLSELLHGVYRASNERIKTRRLAFVEGIFERFPILPITCEVARMHARIWADLQAQGVMIGLHDSWLAATCIAHGYAVVTRNIREFDRVNGLNVEVW